MSYEVVAVRTRKRPQPYWWRFIVALLVGPGPPFWIRLTLLIFQLVVMAMMAHIQHDVNATVQRFAVDRARMIETCRSLYDDAYRQFKHEQQKQRR